MEVRGCLSVIRSTAAVTVMTESPVCLYATTPASASRSMKIVPSLMWPVALMYESRSHGSRARGKIYISVNHGVPSSYPVNTDHFMEALRHSFWGGVNWCLLSHGCAHRCRLVTLLLFPKCLNEGSPRPHCRQFPIHAVCQTFWGRRELALLTQCVARCRTKGRLQGQWSQFCRHGAWQT